MDHKVIQFRFPSFDDDLQTVPSLEQLRERLDAIMEVTDVDKMNIRYAYHQPKDTYLYAKCRFKRCSACLRYKRKDGEQYELTMFKSNHNHPPQKSKTYRLKAVESYLATLPLASSASTIKRLVCQQFQISEKTFYYLWNKVKHPPLTFEDLVKKLEAKGYEVHFKPNKEQGQPPEVFLAINQDMKANFVKYGDVVSFDLTFNLVKNIHKSKEKWKVGCFVGMSNAKRITPFGFAATLYTKEEDYCQIFSTFFNIMGKEPAVIVTDEEKSMHSALMELKRKGLFHGQHLLDAYHILHNVRKKLDKKEKIKYFKPLIHARNEPELTLARETLVSKLLPAEIPLIDKFMDKASRYCFALLPLTFVGFTSTSTPNEKLHDLWKSIQPSQKEFSTTVDLLTRKLEQLGAKCQLAELSHIHFEDLYCMPELRIIRSVLAKAVLIKFIEQLAKSIRCNMAEIYGGTAIVKDPHAIFRLRKEVQGIWACECGYKEKSGLPCSHLLRFLIIKEEPLFGYIHKRWIISEQKAVNKEKKTFKRGRQRLSRRN